MKKQLISFIAFISLFLFSQQANASADNEKYKDKINAQVNEFDKYRSKLSEFEASDKFQRNLLYTNQPFEVTIGTPDAPLKLVEYMSLTCSHCKEFHENVYYKLKKELIDNGKLFMRVRHFPLNGSAVKAVMILDCVKPEDKMAFIGALFKSQPQWAFVQNESQLIDRMKTISKIGGLNDQQFETCYNDDKKQDEILMQMKTAAEGLMVDSTPSLYVNGTRYLGTRDYESFRKALDAMPADTYRAQEPLKQEATPETAEKE